MDDVQRSEMAKSTGRSKLVKGLVTMAIGIVPMFIVYLVIKSDPSTPRAAGAFMAIGLLAGLVGSIRMVQGLLMMVMGVEIEMDSESGTKTSREQLATVICMLTWFGLMALTIYVLFKLEPWK